MNANFQVLVDNPTYSWTTALDLIPEQYAQNSLLLGFEPEAVYTAQSSLETHTYIIGPSGCGKTSRVIVPQISQLIRTGKAVWCIDAKPDPSLWAHLKEEASAAGRRVRLFSMQPGVASEFSLDLLGALNLNKRHSRQIAQLLLGSLGLDTAAEPFFISQNEGAITAAIDNISHGNLSFTNIAKELRKLIGGSKRYEHATHALDVIESLADAEALNSPVNRFNVAELLQSGDVCYFCLPVSTELKTTCATTAALLLKTVALASKDLALLRTPVPRLNLVVDEFQEVASAGDLENLLSLVRGVGHGISLILSHQVAGQVQSESLQQLLKSVGYLVFLAPRAHAKELMEWSGERIDYLCGGSVTSSANGSSRTQSWQETIRSGLSLNTIQAVNRADGFAIAVLSGGAPTPIFLPHHVDLSEARRRQSIGFPKPSKGQPARPSAATSKPAKPTTPVATKVSNSTREQVALLFAELRDKVLFPGGIA